MKSKRNPAIVVIIICFLFTCSISFAQNKTKKEWDIPTEYKTMKNQVKNTPAALTLGKEQYKKQCAACHGINGKGDGEKSKSFANITPANLQLDQFTNETDGDHFYKIKIGRNNLHSFKGKLDDEAIWSIIHYMKTFKKQ